jgi:para-nitrobenzyl esterase
MVGPHPPRHLATAMHRAWVQFATHGDPGWERFSPQTRRIKVFDGNDDPVATDPRGRERDLWQDTRT